jgi:uncharacterized protein (DUF433 family)
MNWRTYITVDPDICHGKACFAGARIPVTIILASLASGVTSNAVLETYPVLTSQSIRASLAYAAELATERVVLLPE